MVRLACSEHAPDGGEAAYKHPRRHRQVHSTPLRSEVTTCELNYKVNSSRLLVLSPFYRAIENGANAIAEGFLFGVAALLIVGETWRSSRSSAKRRTDVDDRVDTLSRQVETLSTSIKDLEARFEERWDEEKERHV